MQRCAKHCEAGNNSEAVAANRLLDSWSEDKHNYHMLDDLKREILTIPDFIYMPRQSNAAE